MFLLHASFLFVIIKIEAEKVLNRGGKVTQAHCLERTLAEQKLSCLSVDKQVCCKLDVKRHLVNPLCHQLDVQTLTTLAAQCS